MPNAKITKKAVDAIKPGSANIFLWDTELRGFGLKVTPGGNRSYVLQYRLGGREAKTRRYTIGSHGSPWTAEKARQEAERLLILVKQGIDPADAERDRRREAVELAFKPYSHLFFERHVQANGLRSGIQAKRALERLASVLRDKPLSTITRQDITRAIVELTDGKPAMARYFHAILHKLFRWAVGRGDIAASPMTDMPAPPTVRPRDRVLEDRELAEIWHAAETLNQPFGPIYKLLISTGARREEVGAMAWEEVDLDQALWTLPAQRAKNGQPHLVPLSDLALSVLKPMHRFGARGLIFSTTGVTAPSGWSKAKSRIDTTIVVARAKRPLVADYSEQMPSWRLHDIRRTVATGLQRLGVRFEVTEAVLNHVSGSRGGVAGIYQRHHWMDEKRLALDAWGRHVTAVIQDIDRSSNVIPFVAGFSG